MRPPHPRPQTRPADVPRTSPAENAEGETSSAHVQRTSLDNLPGEFNRGYFAGLAEMSRIHTFLRWEVNHWKEKALTSFWIGLGSGLAVGIAIGKLVLC